MTKLDDIQFLRKVIDAQSKLLMLYRVGKPQAPEWVLDTLAEYRKEKEAEGRP